MNNIVEMTIQNISIDDSTEDLYWPVTLRTTRGPINYRYYYASGSTRAVIFLDSVEGDYKKAPHGNLYRMLARDFTKAGVSSLWVDYRNPTSLIESILDTLAGVFFLQSQQFTSAAIVGHSFGGAVALQAAAASHLISSIVAISTQLYGIDAAGQLKKDCRAFFIHGIDDDLLSPLCSVYAYNRAPVEQKEIILYDHIRHDFKNVVENVRKLVASWILAPA